MRYPALEFRLNYAVGADVEMKLWREVFRVLCRQLKSAEARESGAKMPDKSTLFERAVDPSGDTFFDHSRVPPSTVFRLPWKRLERFPPGQCAMPHAAEAALMSAEDSCGPVFIMTTRGGWVLQG